MRHELDGLAFDTMREISSIGAGHASMVLSMMTSDLVRITFPKIKICPLESVPPLIGKPAEEVANIFVHIDKRDEEDKEKIQNLFSLLLIFPMQSAVTLASLLQGKEPREGELDEMDISTLQEVGNILVGSYVSAIADYVDLELVESIPDIATDMLDSVMDAVMAEHGSDIQETIVFDTEFIVGKYKISSHLLVFLCCDYYLLLDKIKRLAET